MENLEQPREPAFYPKNEINVIQDKTLQSIDDTLKRIEAILLDFQKNQKNLNPLSVVQDAVAASISRMK